MKFDARLDGLDDFNRALSDIAASGEIKDALKEAASGLHDAAIARLHDGQPPESVTGALASSLQVDLADDGMSATVGTSLDYSWQLEFGSLGRPATPWLEPALRDAQPGILARIRRWLASSGKTSAG
jgi:hypothetical protein